MLWIALALGAPVFTLNLYGEPGIISNETASHFTLNLVIELSRTLNPPNVFWTPMRKWHKAVSQTQVKPLPSRAIDFLYVSSNCDPKREALAAFLRAKLSAAKLRWAYGGRCTAGAPSAMASPHQGTSNLTVDVMESKTMFAMSRSQNPAYESLDEKLALPVLLGATIPVYVGNGHRLIREARYPNVMVDRADYATDEEWASGLVNLLGNATEMIRRQTEMYDHPFHFGSPAARDYVRSLNLTFGPPGSLIGVYSNGRRHPPVFLDQLDYLFERKYQFTFGNAQSPVHIHQCCW